MKDCYFCGQPGAPEGKWSACPDCNDRINRGEILGDDILITPSGDLVSI
jgi:hypothetical protein